ncbi:MAG: PIG-L family deacetylase, partial [Planctomycetaceae bacterium]|nr:PIG-L family deacetylase [Planctomycetaceae bacterium]
GARLRDVRSPWCRGPVDWTPELEKRAVIWLSEQTSKPILKLEEGDFLHHHLADLVNESGPIANVRNRVFDSLNDTLCTEPAGPSPQTVLVFSPHPDDDVISMGGTLITLAEQGHDVHIAYMTSGNIAVFDHDVIRHVDFVTEFLQLFGAKSEDLLALEQRIRNAVSGKGPGEPDPEDVLKVKGLIRKTEAIAAAECAGVPEPRCHFLDMPFYQTGLVEKRPIGKEDVAIVAKLIRELAPSQVYLAGDLSDPHGTHRMCAQAIIAALGELRGDGLTPETWLYRGAWQEYEPHEIERAVPLSPEVMLRKKQAIFKHESQKDAALFPGHDEREFWVRAEQRTRRTAELYNQLGLPEFYAIEAFRSLSSDRL